MRSWATASMRLFVGLPRLVNGYSYGKGIGRHLDPPANRSSLLHYAARPVNLGEVASATRRRVRLEWVRAHGGPICHGGGVGGAGCEPPYRSPSPLSAKTFG